MGQKQLSLQLSDWLAQAFGADIGWSRLEPLPLEASSRRYFRLFLSNPKLSKLPHTPEIPKSIVFSVEEQDRRVGIAGEKNQSCLEFILLAKFLHESDFLVPEVFFACSWKKVQIVFQSDFGKTDLATVLADNLGRGQNLHALALLEAALDLALELSMLKKSAIVPDFVQNRSFDFSKLSFEMNVLYKAASVVGVICKDDLKDALDKVCRILANCEQERVFVHRDFHSKNLLVVDELPTGSERATIKKNFALLDFQDARMGMMYYDWASLIYDPYIHLPETLREAAIAYVFEKKHLLEREEEREKKKRRGENRKVLEQQEQDMFFLQVLQRLLKALGTYLHQSFSLHKKQYFPALFECIRSLRTILETQIAKEHLSSGEKKEVLAFLNEIVSSGPVCEVVDDGMDAGGKIS